MIKVKRIFALYNNEDEVHICAFGREDIPRDARWGKGSRDIFLIHYVLEGEGYFNSHKVRTGEGFFITPQMIHEYHSSEAHPWRYFWVALNGLRAMEICENHIKTNEDGIFEYSGRGELLGLMDSIFSEKEFIGQTKAMGYFLLLMSLHDEEGKAKGNEYVERAKKYMHTNFYRSLSVTEVAEKVGISDRYLYNLFVKYEGISPKQYLGELRFKRSCSLLKNLDCSVAEAAFSVGFEDALAFTKFFTKKAGVSPREYRKSLRN